MSTRKRPQQELANYFDELLTELDEPNNVSKTPKRPVKDDQVSVNIEKKVEPVKINSTQKNFAKESASINKRNIGQAELNQTLVSDTKSKAEQSSLAVSPKTKTASSIKRTQQLAEKEDTLDQQQQAKLQRLLRNLIPTNGDLDASVKQQLADNFLGKGVAQDTLTKDIKTDSNTLEAAALAVDTENNSSLSQATAFQEWQPLTSKWSDNGRPEWAQEPFDILIVTVNNVNVALPLQALDSIYPIESEITPLFAQAEWFIGLQKSLTGNIKVIDTTQFLMPERAGKYSREDFKYTVAINGSGWGLAVNDLEQPLTVDPDTIRWRVRRSERPWFAGTVKDHMCVLLDIPALAQSLKEKDKNQRGVKSNKSQAVS